MITTCAHLFSNVLGKVCEPKKECGETIECKEQVKECKEIIIEKQVNLRSDIDHAARTLDPLVVNPWGLALAKDKKSIWLANNHSGTVERLNLWGKLLQTYTVPSPTGPTGGSVTGIVVSKQHQVIVVTEDGIIASLSNNSSTFLIQVDNSVNGAVYKGIAIHKNHIYVANFFTGNIEIYDILNNFALVKTFTDSSLVNIQYAAFNVAVICNNVYVSFAL